MAEIGSAFISVLPSMRGFGSSVQSQATRELDPAGKKIGSRFGGAIGLAAKSGLAVGAFALGAFARASIGAASDAQQSIGATETVFGKFADTVIKSSEGAAQAYGLSANEYRENANLLGALFKNQGVALSELGSSTDEMIGKASDLAATFGGTTADAVGALGAAFKGEFDSLERYGISLKESTVSAELAARGQDGLTGAALAAAKQQAITDLIFRQSKDSLGAFGRESDTLAGQQQRLGAQFENIKATVGTALLPVLTQFFGYLNSTALPALTDLGNYLRENFGPAFDRVREIVSGFFNGSAGDAGAWANDIKSIVRDAVTIATELWDTFGRDIVRYATTYLKNVIQIVRGALNIVAGIFRTISALLSGDWRGAWEGIKQITRGAATLVEGLVRQLFNILQLIVSAGWKAIRGVFSAALDGLTTLVKNGTQASVDFFRSLPGRIVAAIGNLGALLYQKGRDLIQGFINGIKSIDVGGIIDSVVPGDGLPFIGKTLVPSISAPSITTPPVVSLSSTTSVLGELQKITAGIASLEQTTGAQGDSFGRVINGAASAGQRRRPAA